MRRTECVVHQIVRRLGRLDKAIRQAIELLIVGLIQCFQKAVIWLLQLGVHLPPGAAFYPVLCLYDTISHFEKKASASGSRNFAWPEKKMQPCNKSRGCIHKGI